MIRVIQFILLILLGGIIEASLTILRANAGLSYSILVGFVIFFPACYAGMKLNKDMKPFITVLSLFLGISVLHLPPRFLDFKGTLVSLPDYLFHVLALFTAYLSYVAVSWKKWIYAGMGFALVLLMFFKGYSMWLHKLNFDSYSGNFHANLPPLIAEDRNGNPLTRDSLLNRITLVDFWHTKCGACFRKFPLLENTGAQYKRQPLVRIIAMNVPLPADPSHKAFEMIQERGYTFPVYKLKTLAVLDSLHIESYPTTILVNRHGEVVFKGSLEKGILRLKEELKNQEK